MKKLLMSMLLIGSLFAGSPSPFNLGLVDIVNGKTESPAAYAVYGFVDGVISSYLIELNQPPRRVSVKGRDFDYLLREAVRIGRADGEDVVFAQKLAIVVRQFVDRKIAMY